MIAGFPGDESLASKILLLSVWLFNRRVSGGHNGLHGWLEAPYPGWRWPYQSSNYQPLGGLHRVLCQGQCWWDLSGRIHTLWERWVIPSVLVTLLFRAVLSHLFPVIVLNSACLSKEQCTRLRIRPVPSPAASGLNSVPSLLTLYFTLQISNLTWADYRVMPWHVRKVWFVYIFF